MSLIRQMTEHDVPRVLEIEQHLNRYPWTRGILEDCLRVGYDCYVLETNQPYILGFFVQSYGLDEAHLLNIGVDEPFHRQGLGQRLLDQAILNARTHSAKSIYLEVRRSNNPAMRLYRKNQFNQVGIRRDYYPCANGREDAVVFKKTLLY